MKERFCFLTGLCQCRKKSSPKRSSLLSRGLRPFNSFEAVRKRSLIVIKPVGRLAR